MIQSIKPCVLLTTMKTNRTYIEIEGDLIDLALKGNFDAIVHGCNCMCTMGAGIALRMRNEFGMNKLPLESAMYRGDPSKLGMIQGKTVYLDVPNGTRNKFEVVNAYTQFNYGPNHSNGDAAPVDYDAIRSCMKKVNIQFKCKHIGLPLIGCGLAGGDWNIVSEIIKSELTDCDVTVVHFKP